MADDLHPKLKLSQQLVMTPQLQQAIRMLSTPAPELGGFVDKLLADRPGCVRWLAPDEPDPLAAKWRDDAIADDQEPWEPYREPVATSSAPGLFAPLAIDGLTALTSPPAATGWEPRPYDVLVSGDPPVARGVRDAVPRLALVTDDVDAVREATWLMRAFRQRMRTFERIVGAAIGLSAELAGPDPASAKDLVLRDIAEAVAMHESTIARAFVALRYRTSHGVYTFQKRGVIAYGARPV